MASQSMRQERLIPVTLKYGCGVSDGRIADAEATVSERDPMSSASRKGCACAGYQAIDQTTCRTFQWLLLLLRRTAIVGVREEECQESMLLSAQHRCVRWCSRVDAGTHLCCRLYLVDEAEACEFGLTETNVSVPRTAS